MPENEEEVQSTEEEPVEGSEAEEEEPDNTDIAKVRREAAERRTQLRAAEAERDSLRDAYRALAVTHAAGSALSDPSVLPMDDAFFGEDGSANLEAITEAADAYAEKFPHTATVRGDVGMGHRSSESGAVDLADMLRSGA